MSLPSFVLRFVLPLEDDDELPAPVLPVAPEPVAPEPLLLPTRLPPSDAFDAEHAASATAPNNAKIVRLFIDRSNARSPWFDHWIRLFCDRSLQCVASALGSCSLSLECDRFGPEKHFTPP